MKTSRISSGSSFEAVAGYSRAIVVEQAGYAEVLISGVTGFNYATMTIEDDAAAQTRQCFATIEKVLGEAGRTSPRNSPNTGASSPNWAGLVSR